MQYVQARAKVKRANEHLAYLQRRIARLENSYSAVIKMHPKFGYKVIEYSVSDDDAIQEFSLIIGDALHNLKCALDYAWIKCLERHAPHAISDKTQFPTHATEKALEVALTDAKKNLPTNLINLMMAKI